MLPLVVAKLQKLTEQNLLEHVPPVGSKWASPIVVLRKSDGDIRICGDYKIGVNHKVFLDSYPIPNVKVAFHALAGMSMFTKIDLTTAYHQIPIDRKLQRSNDDKHANRVTEMEDDAIWHKNSKRHISKGHQTGSRRYKKHGLLPRGYMHGSY